MYRDKATSWSVEYWSDCVSTQNDRLQKDVAKICTTLLLCIKMIILLETRNDKWRNEGEQYSHTRISILQTSFSISAVPNCCWPDWITWLSLTLKDCNCTKEKSHDLSMFYRRHTWGVPGNKMQYISFKKKKWKNVTISVKTLDEICIWPPVYINEYGSNTKCGL